MRFLTIVLLVFLNPLVRSIGFAQTLEEGLQSGTPAMRYVAAHFATGYWSEKGEEFLCPVLGEFEKTKIAIYTKEVNDQTIELAKALDEAMKKYPQLNRSFWVVSEEDRTQTMTDEELEARKDRLRRLAHDKGIKELSMAYLQYSTAVVRWRNSLKIFENADVVVAVIEPGISLPSPKETLVNRLPVKTVLPFYRYGIRLHSKDITHESAREIIAKAIQSLSE